MKKRTLIISTLFLALLLMACDGYISSIPDREVYFKRNINTENLSPFGAYLYVTERQFEVDRIGFGGLLIYHAQDNFYYAVDLACPKEVNPTIRISPPDDSGMCECNSCGEVYDMTFGQGTPTKGISKEALRHYTVDFVENDFIFISR